MNHQDLTSHTHKRNFRLGMGLIAALALPACGGGLGGGDGGGGKIDDQGGGQGYYEGDGSDDGGWFFIDPNHGGFEQEPRILRMAYGRLVEVYGLDSFGTKVLMFSDFVIDAGLISDGQNYSLERNPVTSQNLLAVLRNVTDTAAGGGLEQFFELVQKAEQTMSPIYENDANSSGIYSMVPRNSAIVVQFDDLIDPSTLNPTTVRFTTGAPPVLPFEARVFVDPNHGALADHNGDSVKEFYSSRVIIDTTVSELESFSHDPPLPVNGVGLPPAETVDLANIEVRIPTERNLNVGQTDVLENPSGHAITAIENGPTDSTYGTLDVVRAARSGGSGDVTGDSYNGFMPDQAVPQLVGNTPIEILAAPEQQQGEFFRLPLVQFASVFCAQTPQPGDIIRQPGLYAEVVNQPTPVSGTGEVTDLMVRLLLYPYESAVEWENAGAGQAQFLAAYDPVADSGREACFVRIYPEATGFPENPVDGLRTDSTYALRFSEPMDPTSLTAFDSVTITRSDPNQDQDGDGEPDGLGTSEFVIGSLSQSIDLQEFTFMTVNPLSHQEGLTEAYWLNLVEGERGPIDLAGNALATAFPSVVMTVNPSELTQHNNGRVTRFTSVDEEPPFGDPQSGSGPLPEWGGQHLYDLTRELIKPRPVIHFNEVADDSKPVPKLMTPFPPGVQTPLSGLGSRCQTLWRYCDFGWSLTDTTNHNVDVEGMHWSPASGAPIAETFAEFSIKVGHSKWLPDEYIDPGSLFPLKPNSGLAKKFDNNWAKKSENKIVHKRIHGYAIAPGDMWVHPVSGTKLVPFPLNRDVDPSDWNTWTWRNGDLRTRWGKDSNGSPLNQEFIATGQAFPGNINASIYAQDQVKADALPMLMEFKCYPDPGAIGQNAFAIFLGANSSSKPYFRAFSTGGINSNGDTVWVDPDAEQEANGGFNPGAGGATTWGQDNTFYVGAVDFVTRIARVHSVWFEAIDPFIPGGEDRFEAPLYQEPIKEPRDEDQPTNASVTVNFRGSDQIRTDRYKCCSAPQVQNREPLENALLLDTFGDYYDHGCIVTGDLPIHNTAYQNRSCDIDNAEKKKFVNFLNDEDEWLDSIQLINTAPYYQVRLTFESDIVTGLTAELSALAISWYD